MAKIERRFTERQINTATEVVANSSMVRNWVKGQARFLKVDLSTPEGQTFLINKSKEMAILIVKQA